VADYNPPKQGGTSGQVLAALCTIGVPGPTFGAINDIVLVPNSVQPQGSSGGATAGPATTGAGENIVAVVIAPVFASGTLTLTFAQLDVSNGDGTEKLSAATSATVVLTSNQNYTIVFDGGSSGAVGADLSLDVGQDVIQSAAGGQYIATLNVTLTWAP